jgi:hypothetical protein
VWTSEPETHKVQVDGARIRSERCKMPAGVDARDNIASPITSQPKTDERDGSDGKEHGRGDSQASEHRRSIAGG